MSYLRAPSRSFAGLGSADEWNWDNVDLEKFAGPKTMSQTQQTSAFPMGGSAVAPDSGINWTNVLTTGLNVIGAVAPTAIKTFVPSAAQPAAQQALNVVAPTIPSLVVPMPPPAPYFAAPQESSLLKYGAIGLGIYIAGKLLKVW